MALRFSFHLIRAAHPIVSLNGQTDWPRPLVPVALVGPTRTVPQHCLLDTGSTDTVFPEWIAVRAGIDLTLASTRGASGVGTLPIAQLRYAEVDLRLTDGKTQLAWRAWVAFTASPLRWPSWSTTCCSWTRRRYRVASKDRPPSRPISPRLARPTPEGGRSDSSISTAA